MARASWAMDRSRNDRHSWVRRSNPEERDEAGDGEGDQQRQALAAGGAVGERVRVDAFDDVVAGGGDEHRSGGGVVGSQRARGLGQAHDERIHVGDAHDGGKDVHAGSAKIGDDQFGHDDHRQKEEGEQESGTEFEWVARFKFALEVGGNGVGAARPQEPDDDGGRGEHEKRRRQHLSQGAIEEHQQRDQAEVHHAGSDQDSAGEKMWALFACGTARHGDGGHGRGIGSAEKGGQDDTAVLLGDFLQNVTAVGNRADRDHDQPGLERIEAKRSEVLIGQDRQNDDGQQEELGEGENLLGRGAAGHALENGFQFEQEQAGDAESSRDPDVVVVDERANEIGGEARHFRGDARGLRLGELVPVGKQQKRSDDDETESDRKKLRAGEQGDRVADQSDQREGADSAEGIKTGGGFVLLALHPDQEREKQDEHDLQGFRRQQMIEVHSRRGSDLTPPKE